MSRNRELELVGIIADALREAAQACHVAEVSTVSLDRAGYTIARELRANVPGFDLGVFVRRAGIE